MQINYHYIEKHTNLQINYTNLNNYNFIHPTYKYIIHKKILKLPFLNQIKT